MSKAADLKRNQLLHLLADGKVWSGEELGAELGISRAAISNHIQLFSDLGLDVFKIRGRGYRLANPVELLDGNKISQQLQMANAPDIEVLNIIGSTNDHLKNKFSHLQPGHTCLAEAQTAGRGRHGRTWVSPLGASLYMSVYWRFEEGFQAMAGLSLAIGVAVNRALTSLGVDNVQLKWPNDIYLQGKKLAGVLIEVDGQLGSACDSVIGIGLNLRLPDTVNQIDQPWIDLHRAGYTRIGRNQVAASIVQQLQQMLCQFQADGLVPFVDEWQKSDVFRDQTVCLSIGENTQHGINKGINSSGALLLDVDGDIKSYHGGEISVRAVS